MEPEVDALGNWIGYDEKFELPRPEGALSSWKIFFDSYSRCVLLVSAVCLTRWFRRCACHDRFVSRIPMQIIHGVRCWRSSRQCRRRHEQMRIEGASGTRITQRIKVNGFLFFIKEKTVRA